MKGEASRTVLRERGDVAHDQWHRQQGFAEKIPDRL